MDTLSRRLDSSKAINLQTEVRMHPLVLLSAVDHYNRMNNAITAGKRVVGILIGTQTERFIDISNSYAVPFEEDKINKNVWFLDGNYLDEMFLMFKKVWSRANIVGWYSSGPKITACDLSIHRMIRRYCANPVYCIIDVSPQVQGIPATSYIARETESGYSDGDQYCFHHLRTVIESIEAESIGVDQLLRDLTNSTTQTIETKIEDKTFSLEKFNENLKVIQNYLQTIQQKQVEGEPNILQRVQKILWIATSIQQLKNSASLKRNYNDSAIIRYVTSLMKSFMDVVDLIDRKAESEKKCTAHATITRMILSNFMASPRPYSDSSIAIQSYYSYVFSIVCMGEKGSRGILQSHIDKEVIIHHVGGLETQGVLKSCDSNMNMYLILASQKDLSSEDGRLRPLGAIFVRGSNVGAVLLKEGLETLYTGPSLH